ncbi:MAG: winged helix DNA-binding domain-containing protein [Candidatus Bathyarchaeia archaeon]
MSLLESIPLIQAQLLVLSKQRLIPSRQGLSKESIVNVVSDLCGIQYDPLPVIAQAHYITLWNRVKGFKEGWLDSLLYKERKLIEFMLMRKTLNIVPTDELPYYYQGTRSVARASWIQHVIERSETRISKEILRKLKEKGELSPKDFHYAAFRPLFYSGKIFIARREKGIFRMPYYSLFCDYFPDLKLESVEESTARKWLVLKTLNAFGISSSNHIAYWTGYKIKETEDILQTLEKEGLVAKIRINGLRGFHWIGNEDFGRLEAHVKENFVALLTMMDNLVRDRKWLQQLFGYTFHVEYFQKKGMKWHLNILYNNEFLGFMDPKFDRSQKLFIIEEIVLRRALKDEEWECILDKTKQFAIFHGAETIKTTKNMPKPVKKSLRKYGFSEEKKGELLIHLTFSFSHR